MGGKSRHQLLYFLPNWEDKVDPTFDFQADEFAPGRDISRDVYAHEIFKIPPYDGILLSRAIVEKSKAGFEELLKLGAHRYLRLPRGLQVLGDCGAFSYVNEEHTRYETEEVLDYYDIIGVNYGVSVDHLIVKSIYKTTIKKGERVKQKIHMPEEERKRRQQLTLENASKFIRLHRKRKYKFFPIGVAQGWSPDSYADSVLQLLKMGYVYIGIGGLARSKEPEILKVLQAVNAIIERYGGKRKGEVRFHLFGVAKLSLVRELPRYRVASMDSASYLRKAWLRSGQNYLGWDGEWYTAIRIPQSYHPKVRQHISENGKSLPEMQEQERSLLQMLQEFDENGRKWSKRRLKGLLAAILEYDSCMLRLGKDGQQMLNKAISIEKYQRTLEARPWEKCPCDICQNIGIHVLIFRGTNRNKRRGFHNTWTFYHKYLRKRTASRP